MSLRTRLTLSRKAAGWSACTQWPAVSMTSTSTLLNMGLNAAPSRCATYCERPPAITVTGPS